LLLLLLLLWRLHVLLLLRLLLLAWLQLPGATPRAQHCLLLGQLLLLLVPGLRRGAAQRAAVSPLQ
jgi:hypothetical protein